MRTPTRSNPYGGGVGMRTLGQDFPELLLNKENK